MTRRHERITIPCNKEEKEKIKLKSIECGMTLSTYVRYVLLNVNPKIKTEE